jgi:serine O-acetyltransferase
MNTKELIHSDFEAYHSNSSFLKEYLFNRGLRITVWLRLAQYTKKNNKLIYPLIRFIYGRVSTKYGVHIPVSVKIGKSLMIYHGFGLVVNGGSVIGDNVKLQHGVTLAIKDGKNPIIGDNVVISPGSKIIGVNIGNNVLIGANSVVTKDIPDNAIIAGVPAKILRYKEIIHQ